MRPESERIWPWPEWIWPWPERIWPRSERIRPPAKTIRPWPGCLVRRCQHAASGIRLSGQHYSLRGGGLETQLDRKGDSDGQEQDQQQQDHGRGTQPAIRDGDAE